LPSDDLIIFKIFKFGYNHQGFARIGKFKEKLFSFTYQACIKSLRVYPWFEKDPHQFW